MKIGGTPNSGLRLLSFPAEGGIDSACAESMSPCSPSSPPTGMNSRFIEKGFAKKSNLETGKVATELRKGIERH